MAELDAYAEVNATARMNEMADQVANTAQIRGGDFATIPMHTTGLAGVTAGGVIRLPDMAETYRWGDPTPANTWPTAPPPIDNAPTAEYRGGYEDARVDAPAARTTCYGNTHRFACDHEAVCACGACNRTPPAMWAVPRGL